MTLSDETLRFIEENRHADVRALALRPCKQPGVDLQAALVQIAGYQAACDKLPTWSHTPGILYPRHLSMEQCSSEVTARYKAEWVSGASLTDLTGGFGIDCYFLSARFATTAYVERQEELCHIARHNFALLERPSITIHHADGVEFLQRMEPVDCLFIDPARRDTHGGKTVAIADCEPNIKDLEGVLLQKASMVMVKLSPMLDIAQALRDLHSVQAVHIVSVRNECKELLLMLSAEPRLHQGGIPFYCVNLSADVSSFNKEASGFSSFLFSQEEEATATCLYTDVAEAYLYEPNASILKAGGFRSLAQRFGLKKLHPNSHLYTSSLYLPDFPGRRFAVEQTWGFGKRELKALSQLKQANLTVRNFPASVGELRKRLKLAEGGDSYLFATTFSDEHKGIIQCRKA